MIPLDSQRHPAALDNFWFRLELTLALSLEPVESAGEVAHDQIEVTIAIPIDRKGPRADVLGHGLVVAWNNQRLAVSALQDFGFPKRPVWIAVQDLKQPGHVCFHAGVRARENVQVSVTVNVHQLWSGAGASPHTGHFGHLPLGLQPVARRELFPAKVLENLNLSLVELSNEQMIL